VPYQVALAPLLRFYGEVHLIGTYAAVYLSHIGFNPPLAIFILRSFMAPLPDSLVESARVDGTSHYQIFGARPHCRVGRRMSRLPAAGLSRRRTRPRCRPGCPGCGPAGC
jgi:hypothetical protein